MTIFMIILMNIYYQLSYYCQYYYRSLYPTTATVRTCQSIIVFNKNDIEKARIGIADCIFGIGLCDNNNKCPLRNGMFYVYISLCKKKFCVLCLLFWYLMYWRLLFHVCLFDNICLTGEVESRFYGAGAPGATQAKTVKFGSEEEPVVVIYIVSKIGYLMEYMFVSLFDAVIKTIIAALILSFNDDICDNIVGIKWIYIYRKIWLILKRLYLAFILSWLLRLLMQYLMRYLMD